MKRPGEAANLSNHRAQALRYWREAADASRNLPAPQFVVLCAFQRFEVWEPGAEEGTFEGLRRAHLDLDRAVVAAYGWSPGVAEDIRERKPAPLRAQPDDRGRGRVGLPALLAARSSAGPRG